MASAFQVGCGPSRVWASRESHLVDEAAHARAGRQQDQHVWEEHEVALLFVLGDTEHKQPSGRSQTGESQLIAEENERSMTTRSFNTHM